MGISAKPITTILKAHAGPSCMKARMAFARPPTKAWKSTVSTNLCQGRFSFGAAEPSCPGTNDKLTSGKAGG
eukprot:1900848-Alexandrium_andersonii.AAC.1